MQVMVLGMNLNLSHMDTILHDHARFALEIKEIQ